MDPWGGSINICMNRPRLERFCNSVENKPVLSLVSGKHSLHTMTCLLLMSPIFRHSSRLLAFVGEHLLLHIIFLIIQPSIAILPFLLVQSTTMKHINHALVFMYLPVRIVSDLVN